MQSNICSQRVLKCHFTEVGFPLKHSTKNRGLSTCLIKICQSIPCHELQSQLFVFFKPEFYKPWTKSSSSSEQTRKKHQTPYYHVDIRSPVFSTFPRQFHNQGATSPMRSWSCGFRRWKGSASDSTKATKHRIHAAWKTAVATLISINLKPLKTA